MTKNATFTIIYSVILFVISTIGYIFARIAWLNHLAPDKSAPLYYGEVPWRPWGDIYGYDLTTTQVIIFIVFCLIVPYILGGMLASFMPAVREEHALQEMIKQEKIAEDTFKREAARKEKFFELSNYLIANKDYFTQIQDLSDEEAEKWIADFFKDFDADALYDALLGNKAVVANVSYHRFLESMTPEARKEYELEREAREAKEERKRQREIEALRAFNEQLKEADAITRAENAAMEAAMARKAAEAEAERQKSLMNAYDYHVRQANYSTSEYLQKKNAVAAQLDIGKMLTGNHK